MSTRDLVEQVSERLRAADPEGWESGRIKVPSESWVAYQFSPKHPKHAASLHFTGEFIPRICSCCL